MAAVAINFFKGYHVDGLTVTKNVLIARKYIASCVLIQVCV